MKTARSHRRRPRTQNIQRGMAAGAQFALRERGRERRSNLSDRKDEDGGGSADQHGLSSASRR